MNQLFELSLRTTVVLACAFAVARILRRQPAAFRHAIWICAFLVAAATPAFLKFTPSIRIERPAPAVTSSGESVQESAGVVVAAPLPAERFPWVAIIWSVGVLICFTRLWNANRKIRVFRASAAALDRTHLPVTLEPRIQVAETDTVATAMTLGVLEPLILLPREHRLWEPELLRGVLLHELAHVHRRDCLVQWLPNLVCALHWFNPLVWLARSEMVCEAERACDDAVIRSGISGSAFARDLVGIVQSIHTKGNSLMSAAVTTKIERRIARLIDATADRRPLSVARGALALLLTLTVLAPIAALKAQQVFEAPKVGLPKVELPVISVAPAINVKAPVVVAQVAQAAPGQQTSATGSLSGTVSDPSSAVIPAANIRVTSSGNTLILVATSDAAGQWTISSLPTGIYDVEVTARGFRSFSRSIVVNAGTNTRVDSPLALGRISESVTITAERPANSAAAPPPAQTTAGPIKVGGSVEPARLIHRVTPIFPPSARAQGIEGAVTMEAIIGKSGFIDGVLKVIGNPPEDLANAAQEAVRQWQYTPAYLNGQPVDVLMEITVNFRLQ